MSAGQAASLAAAGVRVDLRLAALAEPL